MPAESTAEMDLLNYDVIWKTVSCGLAKDVDPSSLKLKTKDLKVGKVGDVVLGKVIIGMEGNPVTTLHQVRIATIRQLCPWWTTGTVPMLPATRHKDIYDYADLLVLKPVGLSGTDHDITILKAVPNFSAAKGDGVEWREVKVTWEIFPVREDALATGALKYGYYGPAPA